MKKLHGQPVKNKHEPQPRAPITDAPEWMTDSQKAGWRFAVTHAPPGLLRALDRSVLGVWVVAEDLHRQATEAIALNGLLVAAPNTKLPIQNPYLPITNKQAMIMLKAAMELGFSPSSRSRIHVEESEARSSLDAFLATDPDADGDADGERSSPLH